MSQPVLADVLRYLGKVCNAPGGDLNDAELLQRFLTYREETAFALLVQRYGPMVLSVCLRVLGDADSAEDAFQATFLVLVQRAASIRKQQSVASWLYGVAQRIAAKARARTAARLKRERRAQKMLRKEPLDDLTWQELRTVLDEEIARLPEKNRAPLVLCYFQGKTHEQAAAELGWPTRSLTSRVARGRELLRRQLVQRGISLPAGALVTALGDKAAGAPVGALLTINTVKAAMATCAGKAAAGGGYISASAAALAEQVLNGGLALRAKLMLAVLVCGLAVGGIGLAGYGFQPLTTEGQPNAAQQPEVAQKKQPRVDWYGEPLPPGALARMGTTQFRHLRADLPGTEVLSDPEIGVAFSPDDQVIATSWGQVRLWDANTGNLLLEIKNSDPCWGQVFSPDGRFLAAALGHYTDQKGTEYYVCLWDARTGKLRHRFPAEHWVGHVWQLLFSPDSKLLAMTDDKGKIHLWHTDTGKEVAVLSSKSSKNGPMAGIAFSPDGKTLVTLLHQPRKIWHWDIAKGEVSKVVSLETLDANKETEEGKTGVYHNYLLSKDGRTLACSFFGDRSVHLLDTATGKVRCQLQGQAVATSRRYAFTPGGRLFATAGYTDEDDSKMLISLWDTETGQLKHHFKSPPQRQLGSLTFSPDGSRVIIGGWYSRMYAVASGKELLSKPAHEGPVYALAFTPDSSTLLSGSHDSMLGIWDTATGKSRHFLRANRWMLTTVALVPGGSTFVSGGQDGIIRQHDWRTGKEVRRFGFAADGKHQFKELRVSGDGKTVLSQVCTAQESTDAPFHAWDLATGKLLRSLPRQGSADFADLTADGKHFLGVKYLTPDRNNYTIEVRELASGRLQFTMGETDSPGTESLLTADGRLLIHGIYREQPTIRVRELATGKDRLRIVAKKEGAKCSYEKIAVSPDGRILATARQDKTLQVWDLLTGKELLRHTGYSDSVYTMTFSPNGKFLATGHQEGAILVWDVSLPKRKAAQVLRTAKELDAWYSDLASEDAARAHTAIGNLVEVPEQAVGLFKERLRPAADKRARIVQRIAQLDDAKFAVRDAAAKELRMLGSEAELALRQALDQKPTLEKRRRLEKLLDRPALQVQDPEVLQGIRALEVLEYIAPAGADATRLAAMELLKQLAGGAPQAQLTQQAQAGLRRLETRQP